MTGFQTCQSIHKSTSVYLMVLYTVFKNITLIWRQQALWWQETGRCPEKTRQAFKTYCGTGSQHMMGWNSHRRHCWMAPESKTCFVIISIKIPTFAIRCEVWRAVIRPVIGFPPLQFQATLFIPIRRMQAVVKFGIKDVRGKKKQFYFLTFQRVGKGVAECGDQLCGYKAECGKAQNTCLCSHRNDVLTEVKGTNPSLWFCLGKLGHVWFSTCIKVFAEGN